MPSEPENPSPPPGENGEKQLCTGCMFPNAPEAHFCAQCGAPLSSYAATAPFESLFAEGHVYRQAAEHPRRLIVVIGIWLIFGAIALTGGMLIAFGRDTNFALVPIGAFMLVVSLVMIGKTTRNYCLGKKRADKPDA